MTNETPVKVVAIIPARYHSNRFEGKPLAMIAGRPMIQHVVERAWQSKLLSRVVVATDDERIAEAVAGFGGRASYSTIDRRCLDRHRRDAPSNDACRATGPVRPAA